MHKIKKTLAPIALISLLLSGLAPLPAIAEDKIFQLSKTGSKIYVNDTDDPIFDVNFSGYALDEGNRNYRMVVFDNHNGVISKITTCAYDSCEFYLSSEVDFVADGVHQYFAVLDESVSEQDFRVADEQITSPEDLDNPLYSSDTMFLIAQESKVSISANTSFFSNELIDAFGDEAYPALRMSFSEPVIGDEYFYYTFDITNDKLVGIDFYNEDGWAVYLDTNMNNDSISYQTFMAKSENSEIVKTQSDLIDIKQTSNAVTLNRRPWIYQATDELAGGVVVEDIAGGGDKTTYLSDQATGKILWSSQDNLPSYSVGNNGYPEWDISWATFSAADPWEETKPTNISELTGIVANNRDLKDLPKKPGLESKEQVAGGYNPSEFCQQTCGGDPINFYTGEFFEDATDLSFSGKGSTPQVSRSFSTQKKDELGAMGYGWRSAYSMSIKSATSESLEDTKRVKIVQENGSVSFFDKNLGGTYSAGLNVKATLAKNPNGELVFTRDKRTIFTFTSQGSLIKVADLNGNFLNLGYSNGNLSTVSDNRSNIITYVYNADNLISKVTANNGRSVTYAYNGS